MDYNRVLKTLNGLSTEQFLEKVADSYDIKGPLEESQDPRPQEKGQCSLYIDKRWYSLKIKDEKINRTNLVTQLDC